MERTLLRFRLAGVPVEVQVMHVAVLAAIAFGFGDAARGAVWAAVFTASVLWHELAHALAMRAFGYAPTIVLVAFGGRTVWPAEADPTAREELLVAAAGPLAGLALGGALWALSGAWAPAPPLVAAALRFLLWLSVFWSAFNLLPMLPLDGGLVLDALSRLVTGAREPRWVGWVTVVTGAAVAAAAVWLGWAWIAILGLYCAFLGIARARTGSRTRRPGDPFAAARARARRAEARGDRAAAIAALMQPARGGWLEEHELARLVAWLVEAGRHDALVALCRERLGAFARRDDAAPLARLASEALSEAGAREPALAVAQLAFQQLRIPWHAYDAACHLAQLGQPDDAMRWLERALDAGLECGAEALADPALDPLREREDFARAVARVTARFARA